MKKRTYILSIDGGGIRGIIPLILLKALRKELDRIGCKKGFTNIFDIVAGTSTGAIIATTLVSSNTKSMSDYQKLDLLSNLYTNAGKTIFKKSKLITYSRIRQLFAPKYSNKPLYKELTKLLSNSTLKSSETALIIPSYDLKNNDPFFFKNRPNYYKYKTDPNFYLKDVALASASAPTYFPPYQASTINKAHTYTFVDGGVVANDPSLCAYFEAMKLFPDSDELVILSLGTGSETVRNTIGDPNCWGVLRWANPFTDIPLLTSFMEANPKMTQHMLKRLPHVLRYRLDTIFDKPVILDDCRAESILYLQEKGEEIVKKSSHEISSLARKMAMDC